MTNAFSLDDLREATIKKYAPTEVAIKDGSVQLKSLLKLKKAAREEISAAVDAISDIEEPDDDDDESIAEWSATLCGHVEKIFRLVCSSPRRLIQELDHEDPQVKASLYTAVLGRWLEETQVGEAESSPS